MAVGSTELTARPRIEFTKDAGRLYRRRYNPLTGETISVDHPIQFFEDFLGDAIADPWSSGTAGTGANGTNGAFATTTASVANHSGRITLTSGSTGAMADDIAMITFDQYLVPANNPDMNLEVRICRLSALGNIGLGFTDSDGTTVSEPVYFDEGDEPVLAVHDGCGFSVNGAFAPTPRNWQLWSAYEGNPSLQVKTATAPLANTVGMQILRIRLSSSGYLTGWLDGVMIFNQKTRQSLASNTPFLLDPDVPSVDPTVAYTPFVYVTNPIGTASARTANVDYIRLWAGR